MAPTRLASKPLISNENTNGIFPHGITTRSKQMASLKTYKDSLKSSNKRKADSPLKDATAKRAAFGDITNAFNKSIVQTHDKDKVVVVKKVTIESKVLPTAKTVKHITNGTVQVNGKTSKAKQLQKAASNALESVQKHFVKDPPKPVATRAQTGILKNVDKRLNKEAQQNGSAKSTRSDVSGEPSLYLTALENIPADSTKEECKSISDKLNKVVLDDSVQLQTNENDVPHKAPEGVIDFDKENWNDPLQISNYAMDIFNYLKSREHLFPIDDYLTRMPGITVWMRALLVDWMVEVQESFELNHETLYLAVKLVDLFLTRTSRTNVAGSSNGPAASNTQRAGSSNGPAASNTQRQVSKEELQLLGASSLFIASKFDERVPPLVDDFLYICDGAYTLSQLLAMEMSVLRSVDFDLGIPLSYRFLRRYARCARVAMPTLTLARFVLELCLLEYPLCPHSDSKMAAAALYLALRMKALGGWTLTLQYYTGYTVKDILPLAVAQNAALHKKPRAALSTVRNKYSHTIFFEVAKVPLIDDASLAAS